MKQFFVFLTIVFLSLSLNAQVEKVIVETYYISDANDATDTTGGYLPAGSTTYRIFIDLKAGSKLLSIYGDAKNPLKVKSDSVFFNNKSNGQTFAKDIKANWYSKNTLALDSWLTLGQVSTRALAPAKTYFGVLKSDDNNGSLVGGSKNNGGSAHISSGLISNTNIQAGIPITTADGIDTITNTPTAWFDSGFTTYDSINEVSIDSTMFGSLVARKSFESNNCILRNSGVAGVFPDKNEVLVAQLTTKGTLSFQLNIEVEEPIEGSSSTRIIKYISTDNGALTENEKVNPYLRYPLECGCKDPNYIEFSESFGCNDISKCKTPIVLGCMDPMACNYDPKANKDIRFMCCYPGYCNDRDLAIVCPSLSNEPLIYLFPNPSNNFMTLSIKAANDQEVEYSFIDANGAIVFHKYLGNISNDYSENIDITSFKNGIYKLKISVGNSTELKTFIKQ